MTIYAIFRASKPEAISQALKEKYPDDHYQVRSNEWLVSGTGTAKEISDRLGITGGDSGSAIVFSMGSYYGRSDKDIWDWIATKLEAGSG